MPLFLPEVQRTPAPTGGLFLPNASNSTPVGSGMILPSPTDGTFGLGDPGSLQSAVLRYPESNLGDVMRARQEEMMLRLGLDPNVDTPEDLNGLEAAMAQNEAGLAKLATVNPEFAKEMAARYQEDESKQDKSWWDNVKDFAGDVFSPAVAVGAKALEILSRPAQIVPELMMDEEGDAWYEDIGQALSGRSNKYGDDVVRRFLGEDTPGWLQGVAGFALDVVADPLTWATFGMAGVGRSTAQAALGKTGFIVGAKKAAEEAGLTLGDDVMRMLGDEVSSRLMSVKKLSGDAVDAFTGMSLNGIPDSVIRGGAESAEQLVRGFSRTGLKQSLTPEQWKMWRPVLEREAAALGGAPRRALLASLGGVRVRAGVPFTNYRFTSRAVPGTHGWGFAAPRNFFRGMTGFNRLMRSSEKLNPVTREMVANEFFRGGWEAVERNHSAIYLRATRGLPGTNAMFRLSEQAGKVTSIFSHHTHFLRNAGIADVKAFATDRIANSEARGYMNQHMLRLPAGISEKYPDGLTDAQVGKLLRPVATKDPMKQAMYANYRDLAPGEVKLSQNEMDALDLLNELQRTGANRLRGMGSPIPDRTVNLRTPQELNGNNMPKWQDEMGVEDKLVRNLEVYIDGDVGEEAITNTGYGRGISFQTGSEVARPGGVVHLNNDDPIFAGGAAIRRTDEEMDDLTDSIRREGVREPIDLGVTPSGRMFIHEGNHRAVAVSRLATEGKASKVPVRVMNMTEEDALYGHELLNADKTTIKRLQDAGSDVVSNGVGAKARLGTQRLYFVDATGDAVSDQQRYLDELRGEAEQSFRQLDPNEELLDGSLDSEVPLKTDEFLTEHLRKDYDGVLVKLGDDDYQGVVFPPKYDAENAVDSAWKIKKMNDEVDTIHPKEGYMPRLASDELKSKFGMQDADDAQFWFSAFKHGKRRQLEHMSFLEANEFLRTEHGLTGNAFVMDQLDSHRLYFERGANEVRRMYTVRSAKEIAEWNKRFGIVPGVVNHNTYTWRSSGTATDRVLRSLERDFRKVGERHQAAVQRQSATLERQGRRLGDTLLRFEESIAGAVPGSPEFRSQLAGATRRLEGELRGEGAKLQENLRKALTERSKLKSKLAAGKNTEKVGAALSAVERRIQTIRTLQRTEKAGKRLLSESEKLGEMRALKGKRAGEAAERLAKISKSQERVLTKAKLRTEGLNNELGKIRARYRHGVADAIPAMVHEQELGQLLNMEGYVSVGSIPGLEGMMAHPYIAKELQHGLQGKSTTALRRAWRNMVMGPWKRWATLYYPGFHARNFMGAFFNNWLGGVGLKDYDATIRARRAWRNPNGDLATKRLSEKELHRYHYSEGTTWYDVATDMQKNGIVASNSQPLADSMVDDAFRIRQVKRLQDKGTVGRAVDRGLTPARFYGRMARDTTEVTENFYRGSAYLHGRYITQGDDIGARQFTMMRHGDYEDLTEIEETIRDLVPFYKWMRTNIPLQVHMLLEAPGKTLAVDKAVRATFVAQGMDPEEERKRMAPWQLEAIQIPLGKRKGDEALKTMALDLPMADLFAGANDYLSALLPQVRPMIESHVIGKSIFSGKEFTGKPVPLSGWAKLPGIRQALEPFIKYDAEGNPTISDKVQNNLSAIPIFSRFKNWVFADEGAVKRRSQAFYSVLMGIRFEEIGEEQLTSNEKAFFYEVLEPQISQLRELGVTLPDKDMISSEVYEYLGFEEPEANEPVMGNVTLSEGAGGGLF